MSLAYLCHNNQSLAQLSSEHRALVMELAEALSQEKVQLPYESKSLLKEIFGKKGMQIPQELIDDLEPDDSIEVWTSDLRFIFAMGPILLRTSYTLDELASNPWSELFSRPEFVLKQTIVRFEQALTTAQTQYNVTDWHSVTEKKSSMKNPAVIKIKQLTPFYGDDGKSGVFALVKFKQPSIV